MEHIEISELIGKTMKSVESINGEELVFTTTEGRVFKFYHRQDCCERVEIESIVGDLDDLVGDPILMAEEVIHSDENPEGVKAQNWQGCFTWTFYKFATRKGYVDVRWYGESNGYYSERVDFVEVTN